MKSLEQIKHDYALGKKFNSWDHFCFLANDNMFIQAVDEIARIYAEYRTRLLMARQYLVGHPLNTEDVPLERFG